MRALMSVAEQPKVRVPDGLRVRVGGIDDTEQVVAFQNRYARPAQQQSAEMARHWETSNPQPKRLLLLVEDGSGQLQAMGQASDGGVFSRGDGVYRLGLRVAPEWRRKGVGTALLDALAAHARAQGATKLTTSIRGDEPEGLEFAKRHGFEEYHRRVDSYIDLESFDESGFSDPDAAAAKVGVTILPYAELATQHGATPESLEAFQRHFYGVISEASLDIPSAEPTHNPPFEAIREMYFGEKSFKHDSTMLALRDGKVVGSTVTIVNDAGVAYTVHTGMLRSERGKGIATALKLRAIRALRAAGVKMYGTTNDEANASMRGINARLGYVPDPPTVQVRKSL